LPSAANRNRKDAAAVPVMAIIIAKIERYFTAAAIRTAATLAENFIIKLRYQFSKDFITTCFSEKIGTFFLK